MGSVGALTSPMVPGKSVYKGQEHQGPSTGEGQTSGEAWLLQQFFRATWRAPFPPTSPQWDVLDGPCGHLQVPTRARNPSSHEEEPSCFAAGPTGAAVCWVSVWQVVGAGWRSGLQPSPMGC